MGRGEGTKDLIGKIIRTEQFCPLPPRRQKNIKNKEKYDFDDKIMMEKVKENLVKGYMEQNDRRIYYASESYLLY